MIGRLERSAAPIGGGAAGLKRSNGGAGAEGASAERRRDERAGPRPGWGSRSESGTGAQARQREPGREPERERDRSPGKAAGAGTGPGAGAQPEPGLEPGGERGAGSGGRGEQRERSRGRDGVAERGPCRRAQRGRPQRGRGGGHGGPRLRWQEAAAGAHGAHDVRGQGHLRLPRVRQPLQVDRHHRRRRGHGVRGAAVQAVAGVPERVPVRGTHRALPDALLPPQRGRAGQHLPRHPQGQVVGALRRAHHPALHPEPAGRAQH